LPPRAAPRFGGEKPKRFGGSESVNILEELVIESIELDDEEFFHWKPTNAEERAVIPQERQDMYFVLKATKGQR